MNPADPTSSRPPKGITEAWVSQKLDFLVPRIDRRRGAWTLFEPLSGLYQRLESGDDDDLQIVVTNLARELSLTTIPSASYEWSLKMASNVAGQIQGAQIKIPLFFVGKPYALGGTIAHELSHVVMAEERIPASSLDELELLTDLVAIVVGFGKLLLNGTVAEVGVETGESQTLGYVEPKLRAYAYQKVNQFHKVPSALAMRHLTEHAVRILKSSD